MYCQQYIENAILHNECTLYIDYVHVSCTKKCRLLGSTPPPLPLFNLHRQNIIGYVPAIQRAERLKEGKEGAVIAEEEGRLDPNKMTGKKK